MKANECRVVPSSRLELYLMNLLPAQIGGSIYDDSVAMIEDHLMVCPICLDQAETQQLLMAGLRAGEGHMRKLARRVNGREVS